MALPALRLLDAFPIDHEGQRLICLRDPEGFVEDQVLLTLPAYFIAYHLNGERDVLDIQYAFAQQFSGQIVRSEDIHTVVNYLDTYGLLYTERFTAIRQQVRTTFAEASTRPAYLAGKSYPQQSGALRTFLDASFGHEKGPGVPPPTVAGEGLPARCLIVPHIDFHRGGHSYAHGYLRLFNQGKPDTVFIFGVAHATPPVPFILTRKHFETPFGVLETDQDMVRRLEAVCSWDPYADEIVHRTEHSIEFQAVMLAYLYGPTVRIVPILCGLFGPELTPGEPVIPAPVTTFLETCQSLVNAASPHLSVIAGADLAHVGRRFGDAFDIDDTVVQGVARRDQEDLRQVMAGDADGFYRSVMQDRNARRVCGLNCIYAALRAVQDGTQSGELIHYDYAPDPSGGIVSFANIVFS
jgi:hypothetical protein